MTRESEWVWRSLKAGWGSGFMQQPVYHGWFLCCKILWNLPINSFSLQRAYKQWWNPWGAAVSEFGHRQHLSLFQMVFWVTSPHWCNAVKKGHQGWQIMIFKSKQNPWVEEMLLLFKKIHMHLPSQAIKGFTELCYARWCYLARLMDKGDPEVPPPSCREQNRHSSIAEV